jgi:dihydroflavonol-4-reductase
MMRAFVTGATGFIGGAVVRRLLEAGHEVRAMVRAGADTRQLEGLPVERLEGDLRDRQSLRRGVSGCDWAFHVAALYSSIAALGVHKDGSPATEATPSTLADRIGLYQRSKFMAEEIARDFARQGVPVVIVNPSSPVGIGDHKPTPTGQIIVDFLNGRMFGYVNTGLNIIDVDDVAAGHLLAAERGRVGERYILGGENLTLKQILDILAEASARPKVSLRIPHGIALAWAYVDVALARLNPHRTPAATPEKVRLSRRFEFFDPGKAVHELGLPQTPARVALRKAVEWYQANGYAPWRESPT